MNALATGATDDIDANDSLLALEYSDQLCAMNCIPATDYDDDTVVIPASPEVDSPTQTLEHELKTEGKITLSGCSLAYGRGPSDTLDASVSVDALPSERPERRAPDTSSLKLDHHIYNCEQNVWVKRRSKPQPFLNLDLSIHPDDYTALRLPPMF